jgi:hypothetical protein
MALGSVICNSDMPELSSGITAIQDSEQGGRCTRVSKKGLIVLSSRCYITE